MTNEEAIEICRNIMPHRGTPVFEALDLAIKTLEQKPCEDCVSREAVKKQFEEVIHNNGSATEFLVRLWKLPPVQPTIPTGKWKELEKITSSNELICECSVCGHIVSFLYYPKSNYCTKCGARMTESEEQT